MSEREESSKEFCVFFSFFFFGKRLNCFEDSYDYRVICSNLFILYVFVFIDFHRFSYCQQRELGRQWYRGEHRLEWLTGHREKEVWRVCARFAQHWSVQRFIHTGFGRRRKNIERKMYEEQSTEQLLRTDHGELFNFIGI